MNNKITVGVVGVGFVGKAVAHGFREQNVVLIDPSLGTHALDLYDVKPDVVFICVPTPMGADGVIDASIVKTVCRELADLDTILVLKSTVIPDIVEELANEFEQFVYNPEFLTEANAAHDFENPFMHVFGGKQEYCDELSYIYEQFSICKPCHRKFMTAKEASFVKYSMNSYLALKVIFWNEMKELMTASGVNYETVRDAFICDPRIGTSHSNVPGHDGRNGTGSACFSKDVPALIKFSNGSLTVLKQAWNANCDMRNSYPDVLPREKEQHITFNKIA